MGVKEHVRHEGKRERRHQPACASERATPPIERERDRRARKQHGRKAKAGAHFGEDAAQKAIREREQRLDQRGVLVIDGPIPIHAGARKGLGRAVPKQLEPLPVGARCREVKALVAHEAERPCRQQQEREVAEEKRNGEQRIGVR